MPERTCVLSGCVRSGRLKVRGWKGVTDWRDGEVTVTITRKRATRSELQNAYYWSVVLRQLAECTGYTVDELHDWCKWRFNRQRLVFCDRHGEVIEESTIGQTTTKLDKVAFGEYCEAIRQWAAADLGVEIPDPDPAYRQVHQTRSSAA